MKPVFKWTLYGSISAVVLTVFGIMLARAQTPFGLQGSAVSWSSLEDKSRVAAALNASVRLKDFKAEIHQIGPKENFWGIARRYNTNVDTIFGLNPDLQGLYASVKRPLVVAGVRGTLHQVQEADTLPSIAALYSVDVEQLKAANIIGFFGLKQGQLLFVPGGKPKQINDKLAEIYRKRSILRSPLTGRLTSTMGTRSDPFTGVKAHHNGIDIKANLNERVGASASGVVIYAGWNGGFGKCVKVDHRNGYVTLYGHLNEIDVKLGQKVKQNQIVGKAGSTGRSTGTHLHFTVFYQGKAKNPLDFLW